MQVGDRLLVALGQLRLALVQLLKAPLGLFHLDRGIFSLLPDTFSGLIFRQPRFRLLQPHGPHSQAARFPLEAVWHGDPHLPERTDPFAKLTTPKLLSKLA